MYNWGNFNVIKTVKQKTSYPMEFLVPHEFFGLFFQSFYKRNKVLGLKVPNDLDSQIRETSVGLIFMSK